MTRSQRNEIEYVLEGCICELLQDFDCQVDNDCSKSDLINYAYDKLVST